MRDIKKLDRELTKFCDEMFDGMGRRERRAAMRHYLTGLLLEGDRKSVEPMARRLIESDSDFQSMRRRSQCFSWAKINTCGQTKLAQQG